jgi:exopolysaccharide biosynthesis operon protein EpsL
MMRTGWLLTVSVLCGAPVWAQSQDLVKLRGSVDLQNNDNFFSAPAPNAVSEFISTQTVGVNVAVPYSLQRFELDASLTGNQHRTYSNFDFIGQNYKAAWLWSITPALHGSLSTTRADTLNAATDSQSPNLRNQNTSTRTGFSAIYELGGPWQVLAGLTNSTVVNERALIGQADDHSNSANAGLNYVLGSGNTLGYLLQVGAGNSANDYTTTAHDVNIVWVLTGNTTLAAHVAHNTQAFGAAPQYDYSGVSGGAKLTWRMSGKTSLQAGWQRDLASYRTASASYTQTDALTIAPVWQVTPKTALRLQLRYADLKEMGNPFGTLSDRHDRLRDTSVSLTWQPHTLVTVSAAVSESGRVSSTPGQDFTGHQLSVNAQFVF